MRPKLSVAVTPSNPQRLRGNDLPILDRYQVDPETGCWEWLGWRLKQGYGRCKMDGVGLQAHRVFYEHHVGLIPRGSDIHHRCGNKGCVNPAHLEPLTRGENTRRKPHTHTLLDWDQADEIRVAMDALCAKYGVRPRTLAAIAERQIWKPDERGGGA
jgi:hypothetical protein